MDPSMLHAPSPCPSAVGLGALSTSIVHTTCVAGCRTFLWGGTGEPKYNADGQCWCSCDGVSWSDVNILGRPSCVPVAAHLTFGWAGLLFSVAGLFHAAFHLHRQMRFHEEQARAAASPIEQCRRELHVTAILAAILFIIYFALVVGDELQLSLIVLAVSQIPPFISMPVSSTRMWIYTNDRRVLQNSPEVLKMSRWLETRRGRHVAYSLVLIAPVVAVLLAFANYAEAAVIALSAGILIFATSLAIIFCVCGISLLRGIDGSLEQQDNKQEQLQNMGVTLARSKPAGNSAREPLQDQRTGGDAMLLAARKKVKTVVIFAAVMLAGIDGMLILAMATRYGFETPLFFFASPMTIGPLIWNIVNVSIHRGRTKLSNEPLPSTTSGVSALVASHGRSNVWSSRSRQHQVVAIETSSTTPTQ